MIGIDTEVTIGYDGDDSTNEFLIPFPVFEYASLEITIIDDIDDSETQLNPFSDFVVTNLNRPGLESSLILTDTGQVWMENGGLKVGFTLAIQHSKEAFQPSTFRNLSSFAPIEFEKALDRLTLTLRRSVDFIVEVEAGSLANRLRLDDVDDDLSDIELQLQALQNAINAAQNKADANEQDIVDINDELDDLDVRVLDLENNFNDLARQIIVLNTAGTFTAQDNTLYIVKSAAGPVNIEMPLAPVAGDEVWVKRRGASATINIVGNGKQIDGAASFLLSSLEAAVNIVYSGTEWVIL